MTIFDMYYALRHVGVTDAEREEKLVLWIIFGILTLIPLGKFLYEEVK